MEILAIPLIVFKLSAIVLLSLCLQFEMFNFGRKSPPYLPFFISLIGIGGVFYMGSGFVYENARWVNSGMLFITISIGIAVCFLLRQN